MCHLSHHWLSIFVVFCQDVAFSISVHSMRLLAGVPWVDSQSGIASQTQGIAIAGCVLYFYARLVACPLSSLVAAWCVGSGFFDFRVLCSGSSLSLMGQAKHSWSPVHHRVSFLMSLVEAPTSMAETWERRWRSIWIQADNSPPSRRSLRTGPKRQMMRIRFTSPGVSLHQDENHVPASGPGPTPASTAFSLRDAFTDEEIFQARIVNPFFVHVATHYPRNFARLYHGPRGSDQQAITCRSMIHGSRGGSGQMQLASHQLYTRQINFQHHLQVCCGVLIQAPQPRIFKFDLFPVC